MATRYGTPLTRVKLNGARPGRNGIAQQRVEHAMQLIAQMLPYEVARQKLCVKFSIGYSMAEKYMAEARRQWAESRPKADIEALRTEAIEGFRLFYNECMAKGAYGPAGRALRDIARLYGLQMPERVTVTGEATGPTAGLGVPFVSNDPDAVRARMNELLVKHADAIKALGVTPPGVKA